MGAYGIFLIVYTKKKRLSTLAKVGNLSTTSNGLRRSGEISASLCRRLRRALKELRTSGGPERAPLKTRLPA